MVAFVIALFGGIYDCFTKRVPNWWTYSAIILGLISRAYLGGTTETLASLSGLVLGFVLFFPFFAISTMGGGDVKLLMAVGAWTNHEFVLATAIAAILCGGFYALLETIWVGRFPGFVSDLKHFLFLRLAGADTKEGLPYRRDRKFSFGLAIAAGVGITLLRQNGTLP